MFLSRNWGYLPSYFSLPKDIYREAKAFYERGMYGYAESDLWNLDGYLASWMPSALRELSKAPIDWEASETDLEKMARGFELASEESDYLFDKETEHLKENWREIEKEHEKERIECMNHFVERFHALWW